MEIKEAQELQKFTNAQIAALVVSFELKTGCEVKRIDFYRDKQVYPVINPEDRPKGLSHPFITVITEL
jgi:hypothetical protein